MKFYSLLFFMFYGISIWAQDGLIKSFYPEGTIESQIFYIKDVLDGTAKWYYKNGVPKEERNYDMGKLHGWKRTYYENGAPKSEVYINEGVKDGIAKEFYENGGLKTLFVYDNGILKKRTDYKFDATLKPPKIVFVKKNKNGETIQPKVSDSTFIAAIDKKLNGKDTEAAKNPVQKDLSTITEKNALLTENGVTYYMNVDIPPVPIGGYPLLQKKAVYPREAEKAEIEGEVNVLAFINEYGSVLDAKIEKGLGYGCDESALKAVKSTLFRPGKVKNDYINVLLRIPVKFEEKD